MGVDFLKEFQKILDSNASNEVPDIDLVSSEMHDKIQNVSHIGPYYYYVLDLVNFKFLFISEKIKEVLGYEAENLTVEFLLTKVHPDDWATVLNIFNTMFSFLNKLPVEKIKKYTLYFDFRIFNSKGEVIRLLYQYMVLQHDEKGRIISTLVVHTDITHLENSNESKLCFIGSEDEPSFFDVKIKQVHKPMASIFTKREQEILHFLIKGFTSEMIAVNLSISPFTVNTHRKNILKNQPLPILQNL